MKPKALAVILSCFIILSAVVAFAECIPTRIMPLGDSITEGDGEIPEVAYEVGYRQFLWQELLNLGYVVDFVGSLSSGYAIPGFDADHEGHGGWKAFEIANYIYQWLETMHLENTPADIILLHIGTNNMRLYTVPEIVSQVEDILNEIDRYESTFNKKITVILAQIINRSDESVLISKTSSFNSYLPGLVTDRQATGDQIMLVNMEQALVYPDDIYDTVHPNSSGYEKMANVWQDALLSFLHLLFVEKTGVGQGTVTSEPAAIDCGSTCTASLIQGTVVNLTATADYPSVFSGWTGCDSVSGNMCTVTVGSNRSVTASFRITNEVIFASPSGGEIIPAGLPQFPITWKAPPEAVKFKLSGSGGLRLKTAIINGTSAVWDVPHLKKNKTNAYAKVTAYDSANRRIGYGISDGRFKIEVVSITSPNEGDICTAGKVCPITWTKSTYVPAASIELYYSLKNGSRWTKMLAIPTGDAESFDWTPPSVSESYTKCKIKIVLRDSNAKIVGRHISESFTIRPGTIGS
jgi:lysophospholipase L1-like esterase